MKVTITYDDGSVTSIELECPHGDVEWGVESELGRANIVKRIVYDFLVARRDALKQARESQYASCQQELRIQVAKILSELLREAQP